MNDLVNKEEFFGAKPFPHVVLDNFLDEGIASELLERLSSEKFEYKESDLFTFKQTKMLNESFADFRSFLQAVLTPVVEDITGKEVGEISVHGSLYEDTDHLLCHDDQLEGRIIAYLLYLSDVDEADGGALALLDEIDGKPNRVVKRVQPRFNRLAMFEVSEVSFHAVEEVIADVQRVALGGWFHVK